MIKLKKLTENFTTKTYEFLTSLESYVPRVYSDSKGIPTIGVGYALIVYNEATKTWLRRDQGLVSSSVGVTFTPAYNINITAVLEIFNNSKLTSKQKASAASQLIPPYTKGEDSNSLDVMGFTISNIPQARNLFNFVVPEFEKILIDKLGENTWSQYKGTKEGVALLSLAFNAPGLIGSKLVGAILSGDRAEAWFQIRYQSNRLNGVGQYTRNGLQKRRYLEAEMFGVFNENPTEDDFKQAYRMFTRHRNDVIYGVQGMVAYDDSFSKSEKSYNALNLAINENSSVGSLENELQPAYEFFVENYSQDTGINIDWRDIQVAEEQGSALSGTVRGKNVFGNAVHFNDLMIGSEKTDVLFGEGGRDVLYGEGGSDLLNGGEDDDYLNGGEGKDTYFFEGNFGNDTIVDSGNNTIIINGDAISLAIADGSGGYKSVDGKYTFSENAGVLTIDAGSGNSITLQNWIEGDFGITLLDAPENIQIDNKIYGDGTPVDTNLSQVDTQYKRDKLGNLVLEDDGKETIDFIKAGPTNTEVFSGGLEDLIWGNDGNDILHGESGEDGINGLGGNDVIEGGDGTDYLLGWTGNDRLFAGTRADLNTVFNSDNVAAGNDRDWLSGNEGDDLLIGSTGQNLLSGGEGNDVLAGGAGDDYLQGDSDYRPDGYTWKLGDNGWEIASGDHKWTAETVNNITSIYPTTASSVTFPADYGNDIIYGGGGNDRAWGGNGDDVIYGDGGEDNLIGEGGNDTISGGDGNDILFGDASYIDTSEHGDDVLLGGKGVDRLIGGFGNDVLSGGADRDYLFGEEGEDILIGGSGSDYLSGGSGKDIIYGGRSRHNCRWFG